MKSTIKTAGSFDKVLESCKSIGERYQPKTQSLSITALSEMSDRSQQTKQAVISTRAAYRLAVNSRQESFAGIPTLSVRVVDMLASSGASQQDLADANSLKTQLHRSTRKSKSSPKVKTESGSVPAKRAAARKHFEMRTETFASLVRIIERIETYGPNENDLKLCALTRKLDELTGKSREVEIAEIAFNKARKERQQLVFGPQGVNYTLQAVKRYVRGAFGGNSTEASQMSDAD
jgi:hypothetical protein